jgi:hypothetical protein
MAAWQAKHPHPKLGKLSATHDPNASNTDLQERLLNLYAADEKAGAAWADEIDKDRPNEEVIANLRAVRKRNLEAIKSIITKYGFPGTELVGADGVWAAFALVQHADADHAFQRKVLARMEKLYRRKSIPGEMYAYLKDRVRIAENKKQIFGTQFQLRNGDLVIRPVLDPAYLDVRRKEAGLPAMADYLCYITFRSGKAARMSP